MSRKMHPNSLANLNPRNRDQGKVRFNTTLKPETIAWLQAGSNASGKIEELVALAQSENAHKQKILEDRLYLAKEKLNAVADIVQRWEAEAVSYKASSPRWARVIALLTELRSEL